MLKVWTLRVVQQATWLQYIREISYREPYRKKKKSATCHRWSHFKEAEISVVFYMFITPKHGHMLLSWTLATVLNLVLCFTYKFNIPILVDLRICIVFVSCCIWTETSFFGRIICGPLNIHPFFSNMQNRLAFHGGTVPLFFLNFLSIDEVLYGNTFLSQTLLSALWAVYLHKWQFTFRLL